MLRIALIGCGEHSGIAHAPSLARYAAQNPGQIELVAACDLELGHAKQFCGEYGFARPYAQYGQMLEKEKPDACVCVMPVKITARVGIDMLGRGIPCTIEKPMGANVQEVRDLAQVAARTRTPHMVSVNRRFLPHLVEARQWAIKQGPVRYFSASMLRVRRSEKDFVWGTGMHVVDALRSLGGEVVDCQYAASHEPGGSPWYWASLKFAGGAGGLLHILPTAGVEEEIYELAGSGYRAQVVNYQGKGTSLRCWRDGKLEVEQSLDKTTAPFVFRGEYAETCHWISALRECRMPSPGVADVLPSAELCAKLLACK